MLYWEYWARAGKYFSILFHPCLIFDTTMFELAENNCVKVHLVKAVVFPAVKYGCESWTIKKAQGEELMLLNCGVEEDS